MRRDERQHKQPKSCSNPLLKTSALSLLVLGMASRVTETLTGDTERANVHQLPAVKSCVGPKVISTTCGLIYVNKDD